MNTNLFSANKTNKTTKQTPRRPVFGSYEAESGENIQKERLRGSEAEQKEIPQKVAQRKEFTVFAFHEHKEKILVADKIEQARKELILTIKEMKAMNLQVKEVERVAQEEIVDPGIYHLNFFDKLVTTLKVLRKNISESKSWLDMVFTKKQKRGFKGRAKAGGAQYRMSHERRMVTQTG